MDYLKLSKEVSYALRHAPWEYELELDEGGWVEIIQLIDSFRESKEWQNLEEQDLHIMIEESSKKRHEILNHQIRAFYGHSVPQKIMKEPKEPPEILYHGTARRFVDAIKEKGLLPQNRQYVHLSMDIETAMQVGKRRDDEPVLLRVNALIAWNEGVKFYLGYDKVWLADAVPSRFISQ